MGRADGPGELLCIARAPALLDRGRVESRVDMPTVESTQPTRWSGEQVAPLFCQPGTGRGDRWWCAGQPSQTEGIHSVTKNGEGQNVRIREAPVMVDTNPLRVALCLPDLRPVHRFPRRLTPTSTSPWQLEHRHVRLEPGRASLGHRSRTTL